MLPSIYVGYIHSITLCFSVSYMVKCRYVGIIQKFFCERFCLFRKWIVPYRKKRGFDVAVMLKYP